MFRFVLRTVGFLLLAAAAMFAVIDATKSLAASEIMLTPLHQSWSQFNPSSLLATQKFVETYTLSFLWSPLITFFLSWPSFLIVGLIAVALIWIGTPKRPIFV